MGKINHRALLERFAVIDDNRHAFVVVEARDFDFGSHRQAAVGFGHLSFLENLTACGLVAEEPWPIPGGLALHGLGCWLVVCHSVFTAANGAEDQQDLGELDQSLHERHLQLITIRWR